MQVTPKPAECVKIVEVLMNENRMLLEDTVKRIKKSEPHYHYMSTLASVFSCFLELRNLQEEQIQGVRITRSAVAERTLYIAVVLWLYSPAIYNHSVIYNIENGIRHELEGQLLCNESWISQQVRTISFQYNSNYQEFKDLIDSVLDHIKGIVKEKKVDEEVVNEAVGLFQ